MTLYNISGVTLIFLIVQVLKVWVAKKPPGFGFVLMSRACDAELAVECLHSTEICGNRLIIKTFEHFNILSVTE